MMLEITTKLHELNGAVPLFGVLLFTEQHPFVVKCLHDSAYSSALHSLSGDHMAVFAAGMRPGSHESPESRPGTFAMMCMVWREPRENLEILGWFGLRDSRKLPLFVVFTFEEDVLLSDCHPVNNDSPEDVFRSIEQALIAVRTSVEKVGRASPELFSDIRARMRRIRLVSGARRALDVIGMLRGAAGL